MTKFYLDKGSKCKGDQTVMSVSDCQLHDLSRKGSIFLSLAYFFRSFIPEAILSLERKIFNRRIFLVKGTLGFISNCRTQACCRPSSWLLGRFKIIFGLCLRKMRRISLISPRLQKNVEEGLFSFMILRIELFPITLTGLRNPWLKKDKWLGFSNNNV